MRVTLAGHPFATTGMGEQMRSHIHALLAVGIEVEVFDLFGNVARADAELRAAIEPLEVKRLGSGIRIFHVNGDEIEAVLDRLYRLGQNFTGGVNVIVPAWELETYPQAWARLLGRFDEVWALSTHIARALARAGVNAALVGQSVEAVDGPLLPRRHFAIRESATVFLAMIDLSSFESRKNPQGLLRFADMLAARHQGCDLQVVLKVKDAERDAEAFIAPLRTAHPDIVFIGERLSALETRSLIAACDCLVSLHRAEGFGRATAEAMWHGRLAIATGWSGNLDTMNRDNALLVAHRMVPIASGAYPQSDGENWAEPDLEDAVRLASIVVRDPASLADMRVRGARDMRRQFSHVAVGLRAAARIERLQAVPVQPVPTGVGRTAPCRIATVSRHRRLTLKRHLPDFDL